MSNSLDSYPNNASDISKRMIQRMRQEKIDEQILGILQQVFEKALYEDHLILSRPMRVRMFRQSMKAILTDLITKIDSDN